MIDFETEQLIAKARTGDRSSLEHLLVSRWNLLCRHIAHRMPPHVDPTISAEDVAQEALLEAFQKIEYLREPTSRAFDAWLKALGEMSLARVLRHQGRQKRGGLSTKVNSIQRNQIPSGAFALIDELPDDARSASSLLARDEATASIRVALASLPEAQRHAIQLRLFEGLSLDSVAAKLRTTKPAVRGLIHRGKHAIAQSMGRSSAWLSG